jgi:hypothetical protein
MTRWRLAGALLTVLVLTFTSFGVWQWVAWGTETQRASYVRQISALTIDADTANMTIVAGVPGRVDVVRELGWTAQKPEISEHWVGDKLVIQVDCLNRIKPFDDIRLIKCDVDYRLSAPPGIPVTVDSDGGDIEVSQMTGALHLSSNGGDIMANGSQGRVYAETYGGNVLVEGARSTDVSATTRGGNVILGFLVPPTRADAETFGGDVMVTVPSSTTYSVRGQTSGGDTDVQVPDDSTSPRKITATTRGGNVIIGYGHT